MDRNLKNRLLSGFGVIPRRGFESLILRHASFLSPLNCECADMMDGSAGPDIR